MMLVTTHTNSFGIRPPIFGRLADLLCHRVREAVGVGSGFGKESLIGELFLPCDRQGFV